MKTYIKYLVALAIAATAGISLAGSGSITDAVSGTRILASDFNKITSAFKVDLVPRNSSGVATEEGGSIGSSTYPWDAVFIGQSTAGISLNDSAGALVFKTGGSTRVTVTSTGLDLSSFADGLITYAKLNANAKMAAQIKTYTASGAITPFLVPTDVTQVHVEMCGGGGGGGGGNINGLKGGGGGGAGEYISMWLTVVSGSTIAGSVGAGGAGGGAQGQGTAGTATVLTGITSVRGGNFGTVTDGGAGAAHSTLQPAYPGLAGGAGTTTTGTAGESNIFFSGGAAGTNPGGGGGGAAGMFGAGGAGSPGGLQSQGTAAAANTCAGGGGGGRDTGTNSAPGGAGGSGIIKIRWYGVPYGS